MSDARQNYTKELLLVTIGHGLFLGMLLAMPMIRGCDDSSPDMSKTLELYVEPPPSDSHQSPTELMKELPKPEEKVEDQKADPKEQPPDKDEVAIHERPKDKPKDKPPKDKPPKKNEVKKPGGIKISTTLVKKQLPNGKGKLTPEEVKKLLDRGAKLGKHSSLSEADMRRLLNGDTKFGEGSPISQEFVVLDMVRQAMYRAWDQPTDIGIAGLVTKVELTFSSDGAITGSRMINSSGNKVMDASVMKAVQSVRRVSGLPPSYLSSHRRIPVSFELTGNR
jgi:TonB family protein